MPPANSPSGHRARQSFTESRTPSPSALLPALHRLTSPTLDLASTLTVQAQDEIDEDNISFLRADIESLDSSRPPARNAPVSTARAQRTASFSATASAPNTQTATASRNATTTATMEQTQSDTGADIGSMSRRLRLLAHLTSQAGAADEMQRQLQNLREQNSHANAMARYSSAVPSHQSLYDWAPGTEDALIVQPAALSTAVATHREETSARDGARAARESQRAERSALESSLRNQAIENIRRIHRLANERSREPLSSILMAREHARNEVLNASTADSNTATAVRPHASDFDPNRLSLPAAARVGTATRPDSRPRHASQQGDAIEQAMILLDRLMKARDPAHELSQFKDSDICTKTHQKLDVDAFSAGFAVPRCSWLVPGTVFSGFQQSAPTSSSSVAAGAATAESHRRSLGRAVQLLSQPRPWLHSDVAPTSPATVQAHDRWTVKIALHDVDYEKGTLYGTMEAFNVPAGTAGRSQTARHSAVSEKTFSTFVEGELIDFENFGLVTKTFKSSPDTDAAHWRKLEPFASMTEEDISKSLLDPAFLTDHLQGRYVLMRWKETRFVQETMSSASSWTRSARQNGTGHPSASAVRDTASQAMDVSPDFMPASSSPPAATGEAVSLQSEDGLQWGLSIKGFYYVSLRRSDGHIQGLYYDPESTPYQHLELAPAISTWGVGSWDLR